MEQSHIFKTNYGLYLGNEFQSHQNQEMTIFIEENEFEESHLQNGGPILHWAPCVNVWWECDYWLQEPPAWVANSIVTLGSAVIAAGWGATT